MHVGARIGGYELVEELARGGAGMVFRARASDGRAVALKLLLQGREAAPDARQRFLREARALTRLRHPGVVSVEDAGEAEGALYLVMELVAGEDLQARLFRDGPLPVREAVSIARRLAEALAHAHAQGVLHRDLKPANVLVRPDGSPVLGDFGLTRDVEPSSLSGSPSLPGGFLGTPGYWPPEQARGDLARIGPAADVYGLGGLLVALLTGRPPHGEPTSLLEALAASERPIEPPSRRRAGVDPDLDAICLRATAPDPAARHPDATALARDLAAWEQGAPLRRSRGGRWAAPALLGLLLAGGLFFWPAPPAPPSPPLGGGADPAPPASDAATPASRSQGQWLARVRRELDEPVPRAPPLRGTDLGLLVGRALREMERDPVGLERTLRPMAEEGSSVAQYELARLLVRRPRPRRGVSCEEEAAELFWSAARSPLDARPLTWLALLLSEGRGGLPAEPAAARELLLVAEGVADGWSEECRVRGGCTWLGLGQPGNLTPALHRLRTGSDERWKRDWESWEDPPAGRAGRAVATLLGWVRNWPLSREESRTRAGEELRACLLAGTPPERRAALLWLQAAAAAGDPESLQLLSDARIPRADPGTLDWRDLMALDELPVVLRPGDAQVLIQQGEELARVQAALRAGQAGARDRMLGLALQRCGPAETALAREAADAGDPGRALPWAILAALRPRRADVPAGARDARLLVARTLVLLLPAEAGRVADWLEPEMAALEVVHERFEDARLREARLWLALVRAEGDPAAALELFRRALEGADAEQRARLERDIARARAIPRWTRTVAELEGK